MKIDLKEALLAFYRSPVYRMLETESTKLWYDSGEQIYEEYQSNGLVGKILRSSPKHSMLEPYAAKILAWRHQGMAIRAIAMKLALLGCITTAQNIWFFLKQHYGQNPCKHNKRTVS
ncbi:MAG: hypothetical protein IKS92_05975 [Victivallales bacterium]|nr:hypothetical protein [Victivallales bacterium]